MRIKDVCIAAVVCALGACGGDSTSPAPRPSLKVLSVGSGLTSDTVLGVVPDLLRVEVRDSSGQLARGIPVQFHITAPAGTLDPFQRGIFACDPRYATCVTFTSNTRTGQIQLDGFSDASGIASARIQHGTVAMSGQIDISAPSLNIATSVAYTTLPGALVSIALNHGDTSVYVGRSYALMGTPVDVFGNARTEPVTYEAQTPNVATFGNGQVTAVTIGRASFAVKAGAVQQVAHVSVPPAGRLVGAVNSVSSSPSLALVLLDTDGGARRMVATTKGHVGLAWPGWFADNRRVTAVETSAEGRGRIIGYDTATAARSAIVDTVAFPESIEPSYPRSATRVYFYGTSAAGQHGLYRQNLDGSGVELVLADFIDVVSPDEQSVLRLGQNQILNHNLSTGQETVVASSNYTPFWSPTGDLIAYTVLNGSNTLDLHVVRPDGSNDRLLSAGIYDARSFSPDGQWIATIHYGSGIELVRVSDGLRLPVGGGQSFSQVAWRRE